MRARLQLLWERIRSSYWFVPTLMLALGAVLAVGMIGIDQRVETDDLRGLWWVFTGGEDGARSVLSTVAGSVITVAGVTFSITIAVLSLTSSQFGPRLLRGFMRDTGNQIVLGTFLMTFLYCILILRTVRGVEEVRFVPHIAVTFGVVLAIASVAMFVYFIHHVTGSIQADRIIANVAEELDEAIDRLFPQDIGKGAASGTQEWPGARQDAPPEGWEDDACPVAAARSGYIQAVDGDALLHLAKEKDLLIGLRHRPGEFLTGGATAALAWPPERVDEEAQSRIDDAFTVGESRSVTQDMEFALHQLVELAVRALSPGINDPFTAMRCLDRLGVGLCQLAGRAIPSPLRFDEEGKLRVIAVPVTFADVADTAFERIRHYGRADSAVMAHLLRVITDVAACARTEEQRAALREQSAITLRLAQESIPASEDRSGIEEWHRRAMRELGERAAQQT